MTCIRALRWPLLAPLLFPHGATNPSAQAKTQTQPSVAVPPTFGAPRAPLLHRVGAGAAGFEHIGKNEKLGDVDAIVANQVVNQTTCSAVGIAQQAQITEIDAAIAVEIGVISRIERNSHP